jgi:hypothetical protein
MRSWGGVKIIIKKFETKSKNNLRNKTFSKGIS